MATASNDLPIMSNPAYRADRDRKTNIICGNAAMKLSNVFAESCSVTQPDIVSCLLWHSSVKSSLNIKCSIGTDIKIQL